MSVKQYVPKENVFKYQFTNDGYQVAKGVEKEEFALGLPKIYRDFSPKERHLTYWE